MSTDTDAYDDGETTDEEEPRAPRRRETPSGVEKCIRDNIEVPSGCYLKIEHLYGDRYRVNIWRKVEQDDLAFAENRIAGSKFVSVESTRDGLIFTDRTHEQEAEQEATE